MCAIVGVYGVENASILAYHALYSLQHRGKESSGIVSYDGKLHSHIDLGLTLNIFNEEILRNLTGRTAVGHTRYSTQGESNKVNAQPFMLETGSYSVALAHNGDIRNAFELQQKRGFSFNTTSDSEIVLHTFSHACKSYSSLEDLLVNTFKDIHYGTYSIVMSINDSLVAARDSRALRPIVLGSVNGGYVVSSETSALTMMGATYEREIAPGEILIIREDGLTSLKPFPQQSPARCIFELAYFSRPDSLVYGIHAGTFRKALGKKLASNYALSGDVVVGVPDSSNHAALGFSEESRIPLDYGLIRGHYLGRTFIEATQSARARGVSRKFSPDPILISGKRLILIDDSIVRGTTMKKIVTMLRNATHVFKSIGGVKEISVGIPFYPWQYRCMDGIDTANNSELIFNQCNQSVTSIRDAIGADSLHYLTIDEVLETVEEVSTLNKSGFCTACGDGNYNR